MTIALGGDYARDAARYNRLVTAIRYSTDKLQVIGRDEQFRAHEILGGLLEDLVDAIRAECAFIACQDKDLEETGTLRVVSVLEHWELGKGRPVPKTLAAVGHLAAVLGSEPGVCRLPG